MVLFAPSDVMALREVAMLSFHDRYTLLRKSDTVALDSRGNRTNEAAGDYAMVETGPCNLRAAGLQPGEGVIADRLGWTAPYAIDLPLDTLAAPADRLEIAGRIFHIGGVIRTVELALVATAICDERSH